MPRKSKSAPETVQLVYREVGGTHVFTAPSYRGFHIGSANLKTAFDELCVALSEHISLLMGYDAKYTIGLSYPQFQRHLRNDLDGNLLLAERKFLTAA